MAQDKLPSKRYTSILKYERRGSSRLLSVVGGVVQDIMQLVDIVL